MTPELAAPETQSKASLSDDPWLVIMRHREVAKATERFTQKEIAQHLHDSARIRQGAVRKFWSSESSFNRFQLRRISFGEADVEQMVQIWTVGYLAYAKGPDIIDGRLMNYFDQRFVELMAWIKRRAKHCSPMVSSATREDMQRASFSEGSQVDDQIVDELLDRKRNKSGEPAQASVKATPFGTARSARPAILEKLAALTHPEAIDRLATQEEELADGRSQAARLVAAMRDCFCLPPPPPKKVPPVWVPKASGPPCPICAARWRQPNEAIVDLPLGVSLPDLRLFIEHHLDLVSAIIPRRSVSRITRAGLALGLLAQSSDHSVSATQHAFRLVGTPRGSLLEKIIFGQLLWRSPSVKDAARTRDEVTFTVADLPRLRPLQLTQEERAQLGELAQNRELLREAADHYRRRITGPGAISKWEAYCRTPPEAAASMNIVRSTFNILNGEEPVKKPAKTKSFPAIRIEQNGRIFYMAAIPIGDLFESCFYHRQAEQSEGYQRLLDKKRPEKIAAYLATQGCSIPGAVVLSASEDAGLKFEDGVLSFTTGKVFAVIDGQHRLAGYEKCSTKHMVPVAIYEGLDAAAEARLFIDINDECKGVPRALLLSIKGLAGIESERESELRQLFKQFSEEPSSPLKGMLHVSSVKQGKISRTSFDYAVKKAQQSDSYARFPAEKRFPVLLQYVKAFEGALEDKTLLGRRYYFAAMFELFDEVLRAAKAKHGSVKPAAVNEVVRRIANASGHNQTAIVATMRAQISDTSVGENDHADY